MKKQCIATRYVILLLLQLLQGTVCLLRCDWPCCMGLFTQANVLVCVLVCQISRACVCSGVPDFSSSESFFVVLLEPDSLRFMVGHCARLIAVADFFKGMHCFVLYYIR